MFQCENLLICLVEIGPSVFDAILLLIAAASTIAALTPTPVDDTWVARAYRVVDALALNVGFAKDRAVSKGVRSIPD